MPPGWFKYREVKWALEEQSRATTSLGKLAFGASKRPKTTISRSECGRGRLGKLALLPDTTKQNIGESGGFSIGLSTGPLLWTFYGRTIGARTSWPFRTWAGRLSGLHLARGKAPRRCNGTQSLRVQPTARPGPCPIASRRRVSSTPRCAAARQVRRRMKRHAGLFAAPGALLLLLRSAGRATLTCPSSGPAPLSASSEASCEVVPTSSPIVTNVCVVCITYVYSIASHAAGALKPEAQGAMAKPVAGTGSVRGPTRPRDYQAERERTSLQS